MIDIFYRNEFLSYGIEKKIWTDALGGSILILKFKELEKKYQMLLNMEA